VHLVGLNYKKLVLLVHTELERMRKEMVVKWLDFVTRHLLRGSKKSHPDIIRKNNISDIPKDIYVW